MVIEQDFMSRDLPAETDFEDVDVVYGTRLAFCGRRTMLTNGQSSSSSIAVQMNADDQ